MRTKCYYRLQMAVLNGETKKRIDLYGSFMIFPLGIGEVLVVLMSRQQNGIIQIMNILCSGAEGGHCFQFCKHIKIPQSN